jgi:hypothetical protein
MGQSCDKQQQEKQQSSSSYLDCNGAAAVSIQKMLKSCITPASCLLVLCMCVVRMMQESKSTELAMSNANHTASLL